MPPPPDKLTDEQGDKAEASGDRGSSPTAVPTGTTPKDAGSTAQGGTSSGDGSASSSTSAVTGSDGKAETQQPTATANGPAAVNGPAAAGRVPGVVGTVRVPQAVRAVRSAVSSAATRGPRRARLKIKRVDPWSVMKFSFAVSFVLFVVLIVATSVLYLALDAMGVFDSVNGSLTDLISASGGQGGNGFQISAFGVIGGSALLGLINMVLFTALATLGAFIYNVCADLVGGIEITLAERD
jgi:hypothetical protein